MLSLKRPLIVFSKTSGALFLGAICSLALLQEDTWLKARLEQRIKESVEEIIHVPFTCKLLHLDMLGGIITAHMAASAPQGEWTFSSPETIIRFSWLSWLKHRLFDTRLIFQKASIFSRYENKQWAIVDPFIKFIRAPIIMPVTLTNCTFVQSAVTLQRDTFHLAMQASSSSDILKELVATRIVAQSGTMHRSSYSLAEQIAGTILVDVPLANPDNYTVKMQINADLPFVKNVSQKSLLMYTYKDTVGSWQWYPEDRGFSIKAENIIFNPDGSISMDAELLGNIEKAAPYVPFMPLLKNVHGTLDGRAHILMAENVLEYEGSGTLQNLTYKYVRLGQAALTLKGNKQKVGGTIHFENVQGAAPVGNWEYSMQTELAESNWTLAKNYTRIPKVVIEKESSRGVLTYKDGNLSGSYTLKATIDPMVIKDKPRKAVIKGQIESDEKEMKLQGVLDITPFILHLGFHPYELIRFSYANAGKKGKGIVLEKKNGNLEGSLDFEYIKDALSHFLGFQPQGNAHISLKAPRVSPFSLTISLHDGTIKIPEIHNFIKDVQATLSFDPGQRCLTIKDANVRLQKGALSSACSTLMFSENGTLGYAHLPCSIQNAYLSWHKDFSGLLSGAVTGIYTTEKKGRWLCTGTLTLDKAHLKSNLLSSKVQQDLLRNSSASAKNIELDLHFSTKSPLQVKTFFFNTNTEINATIKGTLAQPLVTGLVELNKGSFIFPYKPLYVSLGKLYLTPDQPDDPVIQLTAKNTIKKYAITMHITGSLHHPKISFESSPSLPEEKIITLLLSGSEEGPLYLAMPNIVMMHLESLLFGSDEHSSKAQQFIATLLKPLKNVRFVPTWSGQDGKDLQGTIEVDFSDRLRAKARNNLKLSEETKFELEYSLSDDMTVKAVRDDTGSLGGEVEMRWKF